MKTIIFTFALAICVFTANGKTLDNINSFYKFPFSQGDAKWKEFKTAQDRIAALQIPEKTMALISTEDLLLICLDFPYLSDVFAFDDLNIGVKVIASKFNGFQELLTRQDLPEVLEIVFQRISSENLFLSNNSDIEIGDNSIKICILSYLLGRPEILNKMTYPQKENLLQITQGNINTISHHSAFSKTLSYSALKTLKQLLNGSTKTQNGDYLSVTRYTPNGSSVLAWKLLQNELSVYEKNSLANYVINNYGATVVSEATKTYNCHAYAWHMTEGGDSVWIGLTSITDENIYWEDNSYIEVPESLATKVSYYESSDGNHSAIRISNNLYRSKWGSLPLVEHAPNICPYNTTLPKKYYVRTPYISGPSTICSASTNTYMINYPITGCTVTWNTDNSNFTISPSGNHCFVTYTGTPQYSMANLTATVSWNNITIKTLTKRIVMHGTDMMVYGQQLDEVTPFGTVPGFSFTIPASEEEPGLNRTLAGEMRILRDRAAARDSIIWTDQPIVFEESSRSMYDEPEYGITEINGEFDISLFSTRFDGMNITFSGDHTPLSYSTTNYGVQFRMPAASSIVDINGYYDVILNATSLGGCHDFCLYFRVTPVDGQATGDAEIFFNLNGSSLEVCFYDHWNELPNGMLQNYPWTLNIYRVSSGTRVHNSVNTSDYKTVSTSGWSSGVYLITVDCNGNHYTKMFCIS